MEVLSLDTDWEPVFWKHVNQNIPYYFFFVFDWRYHQDETEIFLAVTGRKIEGMMLTYQGRIAQFRGSREAVSLLLENLDLEEVELTAPEGCKELFLERYEPTRSHELMLMLLHKGGEKLHINHPILHLDDSDADQIAAIMNQADPESWGDVTVDRITDVMSSVNWTGIYVHGETVSICGTRLIDEVGHIVTVATLEDHRNEGYATSLVSHSVKSILEKKPKAMIYALKDNPPAINTYRKVGFKPYKTYYFLEGKRRKINL